MQQCICVACDAATTAHPDNVAKLGHSSAPVAGDAAAAAAAHSFNVVDLGCSITSG